MEERCLSCLYLLSKNPESLFYEAGHKVCTMCLAKVGDKDSLERVRKILERDNGGELQGKLYPKKTEPIHEEPTSLLIPGCNHEFLPLPLVQVFTMKRARLYKLGSPGDYDVRVCLICDSVLRSRVR